MHDRRWGASQQRCDCLTLYTKERNRIPQINLSQVFAGQNVGIKEVAEKIWLVSFMHYWIETALTAIAALSFFSGRLNVSCVQ